MWRRLNSRLGFRTLPCRQWGAGCISEQGWATPIAPLFFWEAGPCSVVLRPPDGGISANFNHSRWRHSLREATLAAEHHPQPNQPVRDQTPNLPNPGRGPAAPCWRAFPLYSFEGESVEPQQRRDPYRPVQLETCWPHAHVTSWEVEASLNLPVRK